MGSCAQCAWQRRSKKMKVPGLSRSCVLLMTILVVSETSAGTLPQLEGIDHWFDGEEEGGSRSLVDHQQAEMSRASSRDCNPDWMETIRKDIRRLSDRIDMRGKGASLADRMIKFPEDAIIQEATFQNASSNEKCRQPKVQSEWQLLKIGVFLAGFLAGGVFASCCRVCKENTTREDRETQTSSNHLSVYHTASL